VRRTYTFKLPCTGISPSSRCKENFQAGFAANVVIKCDAQSNILNLGGKSQAKGKKTLDAKTGVARNILVCHQLDFSTF
jgi:hypothetical protein